MSRDQRERERERVASVVAAAAHGTMTVVERASELREILLKRPSASDDDKGNEVRRCWREGREREGEREREREH